MTEIKGGKDIPIPSEKESKARDDFRSIMAEKQKTCDHKEWRKSFSAGGGMICVECYMYSLS